ncbi:hypothetical protein Patl1_18883 [Pistacia atlantica]|uniref:Uncharacterized protein n=2 Tax=Pistacia TaxID=55512 RepID=A0ACC1BZ85_9ROSI|nr:hypothetical protein Patl1_18883 [Pistacia atlantica]
MKKSIKQRNQSQLSSIESRLTMTKLHVPVAVGELCEICGDGGFEECKVTCDQCKVACQHMYCMRHNSLVAPEIWFCQECCLSNHLVVELPIENKKSVVIEEEPTLQALFSPSLMTGGQPRVHSCSSRRKGNTRKKGKKLSGKKLQN